ncbi:MAG: tryptophan 7-halogenase [Pseudomonadota bacterium]
MIRKVVVAGRDAALWLAAGTIQKALGASGVTVDAIELPGLVGPADVYATLPPLEALHNQLRIDEAVLLRTTQGSFSLGQNFVDAAGGIAPFLHAYGSAGTPIEGQDFFAYWLKARRFGLGVGLEDFSLTAAAARQGRLLIPDDESERYGRSDYGYHLPALPYIRSLKALAVYHGVAAHGAAAFEAVLAEDGSIAALALDGGRRVEGDLFVDATGAEAGLIGAVLTVASESWHAYFPTDAVLAASGPRLASVPVYAEIRASGQGWTGLYPTAAGTYLQHAYSREVSSDDAALAAAAATGGIALSDAVIRTIHPRRRAVAWERNCVAIGEAACVFDPVHDVALHAVQLGLVNLLACFPAGGDFAAQRAEYNRVARSAFERIRDFQSAHYACARYLGAYWERAQSAAISPELAHRIALFEARGEVAPMEDDSFVPDSWRALFTGHGLNPETWLPTIDRTAPDVMKGEFRRMLGFVKDQVLRSPQHDAYLAQIANG